MAARTISPNAADQPQTVPPLSCRKAWGDSGGPRGRQPPRARAGLGEGPAQDLEPCAAPGLAPGLAPLRPGVSCLARSMALGRPCSPRWPRRARRAAAASPVTAPGRPMTARRPRSRPRPGHSTYVFHVCLQARKKKEHPPPPVSRQYLARFFPPPPARGARPPPNQETRSRAPGSPVSPPRLPSARRRPARSARVQVT